MNFVKLCWKTENNKLNKKEEEEELYPIPPPSAQFQKLSKFIKIKEP